MMVAVADLSALPVTMQPVQPQRHARPHRALLYALAFLLTIAAVVVGLLLLGRTDWFLAHGRYQGLRGVGYSQRAGRQDCEVLIYGDSSSMASLDPAIIQRITGLKTCNVSEGTSIQQVVGTDAPLQRYLAQNPPPRVLLTTWTPSFFRPDQAPLLDYHVEGMWYAWRYGTWSKLRSWKMVKWTANYITWEAKTLLDGMVDRLSGEATQSYDGRLVREQHKGQWLFPLPPETHCVRPYELYPIERSEKSVFTFRQKYQTAQTRVIIDISPIPDCDPLYSKYSSVLHGLYDNVLQQLPITDFNEGDVHLGPEGSKVLSSEAAQQVLTALREQAAQTGSAPAPPAKTENKER